MMLLTFFSWWYGRGWTDTWRSLQARLDQLSRQFSVTILLSTLFAPWRRITSPAGRSLEAQLRAAVDNLVSRLVGFTVRLAVLVTAAICALILMILSVAEFIIWPFLPPLALVLLLFGVIG